MNDEDVPQYHLHFGDATGAPGSVGTVFPDPNAEPGGTGKPGYEAVAFAVPPGSLGYWRDRLADRGVEIGPLDGDARITRRARPTARASRIRRRRL